MKVFFDEDNGTGIPRALQLLRPRGTTIFYPTDKHPWQPIKKGTKDRDWIPIAGAQRWLVISQNKAMLTNEAEVEVLIAQGVGIVFLDFGSAPSFDAMRLLLSKWDWLEQVDQALDRPFAIVMHPSGKTTSIDLVSRLRDIQASR